MFIVYKKYTGNSRYVKFEKRLFVITDKIFKKYNDRDKGLAYYRSDEAVQDLQKLLETE
jgi:hypothetical protein